MIPMPGIVWRHFTTGSSRDQLTRSFSRSPIRACRSPAPWWPRSPTPMLSDLDVICRPGSVWRRDRTRPAARNAWARYQRRATVISYQRAWILTHFMAAKRHARVGAARRAMPHGFPGHRASAATHPAGRFAPPKAALEGRLAAPVGYIGRSACGAPRQGARPRLARRPSRAVKWVNIHALWY
jgi:hypothetical protein